MDMFLKKNILSFAVIFRRANIVWEYYNNILAYIVCLNTYKLVKWDTYQIYTISSFNTAW